MTPPEYLHLDAKAAARNSGEGSRNSFQERVHPQRWQPRAAADGRDDFVP